VGGTSADAKEFIIGNLPVQSNLNTVKIFCKVKLFIKNKIHRKLLGKT
jgi:hypothetical protein